jgi:hypothetical protein
MTGNKWHVYRRALKPDLICESSEDEVESRKRYVDEASLIVALSDSEAMKWFDKNGLDAPSDKPKTKVKNKRGRPAGTVKNDPAKDAKLYIDWKVSGSTLTEFSRNRNESEEEVRAATGRHRKRLRNK